MVELISPNFVNGYMEDALQRLSSEIQAKDLRTASKRRSARMNCRVSVAIAWNGKPGGVSHSESGFTRVVNYNGCLLVCAKEIDLRQRLRVTNLSTRQEADAEVVWKGTRRPDGWDLGVKLIEPMFDFWGVDF
jgi:hypothetical protein